jgi:hypothetical protein
MIISSPSFLAVVFAGTDDLKTALLDMDVVMTSFGDENFTLPDPRVRIHSGFNQAVFGNGLYHSIRARVRHILDQQPSLVLYTTGHSLGAANAFLTAVGLALQGDQVRSINFGCPRIGNTYWRDFVHQNPVMHHLEGVWRVVLGWDLVPRLPELMVHAGHTIQLDRHRFYNTTTTAEAFYQHYGDSTLGFAGVPWGWAEKPFFYLPGALGSHHAKRYHGVFAEWKNESSWVTQFVPAKNNPVPTNDDDDDDDDDDLLPSVDDDFAPPFTMKPKTSYTY